MKIRSIYLTMSFALALTCVMAQEQFTLIGNSPLDVRSMGLMQNNFGADEKLEGNRLIKACESIDNSMVVIFADQIPAATLEEWFSKPGVCNSLREFLRRGGVLYFGWNSWTNLNQSLTSTRGFYKSCELPFPSIYELADFPHEVIKDLPKDAVANKECDAAFLRSPYDYTASDAKGAFQMTSIRWFKNWSFPGLETYFSTAEGEPVVVGIRNVLGKGTAIYSDCFSPMRQKEPYFIANLIEYAYGKREKVSAKNIAAQEIARLTGNAGKTTKVEVPPILKLAADKASAETLSFTLLEKRTTPELTSEAQVFGNAGLITVVFKCMRPEADKVVNKCSKRDDTVWYDDAVCIMFADDKPEAPNHSFILNSDGAVYDSRGQNALWNGNYTLKTQRYPDYWEGEFSIAPSEFGVDLAKDHYILFNIGREGTPTKEVTSAYPGYNIPSGYAILGIGTPEELAADYTARRQPPVVNTPYIIWTDTPYRKKFTTSLPATPEDKTDLTITVARNEQESAALFITNFTDRNMVFRLEPDFKLQGTEIPFTDLLTLKEAIPRLNQVGDPQFDGISGLNEAGIVSVPSFETKMLWLDVKTMLPAGTYKWNLETVPTLARDARKKFHVTVEVLDYEFPKRLRADVWGFGPYIFSFAEGKRPEYYKMWREHHINYICHWLGIQPKAISYDKASDKIIISENPEDYDMDEEWLLAQDLKWFYSYGSYWPFVNELKKYGKELSIDDEEFRELFATYLKNWAASLHKRNIPFDRFYVEFQDEPTPDVYDAYIEAMQFLRKTVPEFQTFGTMPTWIDREFLERCKGLIDLWVPWEPRITDRASGPEELEFYHANGKKFLPYLCAIGLPQVNMQTYCRFRGIRSYLMDNDGFAQWGFNSWRQNEWFPSDAKDAWNGFMFYHGNDGAIVCPRMEAFREAAEDLHMLLTAKEILKNSSDAELAKLVSKDTLNGILAADDTYKTYEWRTALLKRLAILDK